MQYKIVLRFFIWALLGIGIGLLSVYICLPKIMEYQISKRLPPIIDGHTIEFEIDKIGLFNTSVSNVRFNESPLVDHAKVDYNLGKLPEIKIKNLMLSGFNIKAKLDQNNQLTVQNLKLPQGKSGKTENIDLSMLSYLPDRISIRNSKILLTAFDQKFYFPFDVQATIQKDEKKIVLQTNIFFFGQKVTTQLTYDLNMGPEQFFAKAISFDLGHLNSLLSEKLGNVKFNGQSDLTIKSSALKSAWFFSVSKIGVSLPLTGEISNVTCDIKMTGKKVWIEGSFSLSNDLFSTIGFLYSFIYDPANTSPFSFKLKNKELKELNINYKSALATIQYPDIILEMTGNLKKGVGSVHFKSNKGKIEYQKQSALFSSSRFDGDIYFDFSNNESQFWLKPDMVLTRLNIVSEQGLVGFPFLHLSGQASQGKGNGAKFFLNLAAKNGTINLDKNKVVATGIKFDFPIQYPFIKKDTQGKYQISKIIYDKRYSLGVNGKIVQSGERLLQVDGKIDLAQLPGVHPRFDSQIDFENPLEANLNFNVKPFQLTDSDIKKNLPQFKMNTAIEMTVIAKGNATFSNHRLTTAMNLRIKDGRIFVPDTKLILKGINTDITFNDLFRPETVPGQVLTIDSIKVDKIKIDNAKIRYSIEDAKYLLIENLKFSWCNGIVSTEAIRFPQKKEAYTLILYCDRLDLTELLKQMGVFHAEGSGTLNGRIPIVYNNGDISFDNGFLFSTPGSGGKVSIENTDKIIAGIPMDSPQFSQLDLAREALKDFDYKWAKLTLNTFEDTLFVKMELDGKPSKVLPFEFKKELGSFTRVDASSPGSHFQGIKLDVNLNLPFNEVMKFGNKLKAIFNQ